MIRSLLLVGSFLGIVSTGYSQSFTENDFKALQGLEGLWKMETGRGTIYEEWQTKTNNKMTGRSYRINNTDTIVMERIELYREGNDIVYSPVVSNQNNQQAVPFKLISITDGRYIFENKAHDFPQRVIYKIESKDAVHARIEGIRNGQERGSDFRYSRVK
jgi:hypothetical protein